MFLKLKIMTANVKHICLWALLYVCERKSSHKQTCLSWEGFHLPQIKVSASAQSCTVVSNGKWRFKILLMSVYQCQSKTSFFSCSLLSQRCLTARSCHWCHLILICQCLNLSDEWWLIRFDMTKIVPEIKWQILIRAECIYKLVLVSLIVSFQVCKVSINVTNKKPLNYIIYMHGVVKEYVPSSSFCILLY